MLALLVEAPLRIELEDGSKILVAVHGGFFSVDSDRVNVIAEAAELAQDIDIDRAKAALSRAQAQEDSEDLSPVRRAEARLQVASA